MDLQTSEEGNGQVDRTRRLVIGFSVALVVGFVAAGVFVLREELGLTDGSERVPSPSEIAWDYLIALDGRDAAAAAKVTDNPAAANAALAKIFDELPDADVSTQLSDVKAGEAEAVGEFDVSWALADSRMWEYRNKITLVNQEGQWRVRWSPALVHPDLRAGQHLAVVTRSEPPAVVDVDGEPLMKWQGGNPVPVRQDRALRLQPTMTEQARERSTPETWAVAAIDPDGKRAQILPGEGPDQPVPVRSTLSIKAQDAAQSAVDSAGPPSALVAFRPSTGGILAVAQNEAAAAKGPMALSGLYSPGSAFKMATATAAMTKGDVTADSELPCPEKTTVEALTVTNDGDLDLGDIPLRTAFARSCNTTFGYLAADLTAKELVAGADQLGLNADFAIPGLPTEAGAVRRAEDDAQRIENAIGRGAIHTSPFGVALMSATVAAGKPVTPALWLDYDTKVIEAYEAPSEEVLTALRTMMREAVTAGTAQALRGHGDVYGKTGTAKADGGGQPHSWFTGYRDDVAFAVLVENGGSAKAALKVAGKFLGG